MSIAWLALHYPEFVQAERASAKTDYDILQDAYTLAICEFDAPQKPECSIPYLERVMPSFVEAAKAQGKSDTEMLADAIAIGLCAAPTQEDIQSLGEVDVDALAPGSESVIEAEFDPPATQLGGPITVSTDATNHCPEARFVLPDYSSSPFLQPAPAAACLAGLDNVALVVSYTIAQVVKDFCACPDGSPIDLLFSTAEDIEKRFTVTGGIIGPILRFIANALRTTGCNIGVINNYVSAFTRCGIGDSTPVMGLALLMGVIDRWVATVPDFIKDAIHKAVAVYCPTGTPSAAEANALFASNFLTRDQYECLMRNDNARVDFGLISVESERERPTDEDLLLLLRKSKTEIEAIAEGPGPVDPAVTQAALDKQAAVKQTLKFNGWTNDQWLNQWIEAKKWVPSPSDAVEWMLKDVADPIVQETFALGAEFQQKYSGHVRDVFQWSGIQDQDAELIWRSHWRNMAPHQLYELHKRLRPGWTNLKNDAEVAIFVNAIAPRATSVVTPLSREQRPLINGPPVEQLLAAGVDPTVAALAAGTWPVPTYYDELGGPLRQRAWLESLGTTGFHVSDALGQADFPPFWRQRLLATSYIVMGRIDLRRAYETDSITFPRLIAGMEDQGSAPGDAVSIANFYKRNAILTASRKPIAGQWVREGYDEGKLRDGLIAQGMRPDLWESVLAVLKPLRAIRVQQECIAGTKRGYLLAMLTPNEALQKLQALGVPEFTASGLIEEWNCVKESKSRSETAAQICYNTKLGLTTPQEAIRALRGLNYTLTQAKRILATCYIRDLPKTIKPGKLPEVLQQLGGV